MLIDSGVVVRLRLVVRARVVFALHRIARIRRGVLPGCVHMEGGILIRLAGVCGSRAVTELQCFPLIWLMRAYQGKSPRRVCVEVVMMQHATIYNLHHMLEVLGCLLRVQGNAPATVGTRVASQQVKASLEGLVTGWHANGMAETDGQQSARHTPPHPPAEPAACHARAAPCLRQLPTQRCECQQPCNARTMRACLLTVPRHMPNCTTAHIHT
jgi:hypothetical protein